MVYVVMNISLAMLGVALLISLARLLKGPTLPDRIVAMDLIAVLTVGVMVTEAAGSGQSVFLDAAIVIALVGFLGTVAYTWYVDKEQGP